ncbi:type II toxin-antitoxin system HicB family antitoxin [Paenibacillus filicis]|uniref:Type II toxin-antitoxin system HicB family antitoxin n=2 Tax=Paenibacillus filicis TaxID=669464 RepID=A0ABU9DJX1_9BACL
MDGTYFVARVLELDGSMSDGKTIKEALSNIREAIQEYREVKQEFGDFIPPPVNSREIVKLLGEYTQDEIKGVTMQLKSSEIFLGRLNEIELS